MGKESTIQTKILGDINSWDNSMATKLEKASHVGWPDILAVTCGISLYVETKAPGKKPEEHQKLVHEKLRKCGALVYVCDNVQRWVAIRDEIRSMVRERNFPGQDF